MTDDKQTNRHKKKGKKQQHQHQNDVAFNFENVFVRWFGSFAYALNMCEASIRKQFCELFTVYIKERKKRKRGATKKNGQSISIVYRIATTTNCDSHLSKWLDKNFFVIFHSEERQVRKWKKTPKTLYTTAHVKKIPLCAEHRNNNISSW